MSHLDNPEGFKITFGEYQGETLGWIAAHDILYLDWLRGRSLFGQLKECVDVLCEKYSHEIESAMNE